ncbi:Cysteine protease atg4 [Microbotryomycetes sp. JL221]|nr:Cysteine protease atg4 [Microbotryomycetes sp. JL221]
MTSGPEHTPYIESGNVGSVSPPHASDDERLTEARSKDANAGDTIKLAGADTRVTISNPARPARGLIRELPSDKGSGDGMESTRTRETAHQMDDLKQVKDQADPSNLLRPNLPAHNSGSGAFDHASSSTSSRQTSKRRDSQSSGHSAAQKSITSQSYSRRHQRSGSHTSRNSSADWNQSTAAEHLSTKSVQAVSQNSNESSQWQMLRRPKSTVNLFGRNNARQQRHEQTSDREAMPPPVPSTLSSSGSTNSTKAGATSSSRFGAWFVDMVSSNAQAREDQISSDSKSPYRASPRKASNVNSSGSSNGVFSSPSKNRFGFGRSSLDVDEGSTNSSTYRLGALDRMFDRAMQYFVDSDSNVDKCEDDIWLMGLRHPGYRPEPIASTSESPTTTSEPRNMTQNVVETLGKRGPRNSNPHDSQENGLDNGAEFSVASINGWPGSFYRDFYSRVALTYRTGFPPIPCSDQGMLGNGMFNAISQTLNRSARTSDGLSSDAGWGCMLRTGQSMLANALIFTHLGRGWRRSLSREGGVTTSTTDFATYSRIVSMFIDSPAPLAPFSVHRFAEMGQRLGKAVGQWFGPSTAAGAIKTLVNEFAPAGIKVVNAIDGTVFASDIAAAANEQNGIWSTPVLLLIGVRLGIDGVNPIYHDAIKADSLFYIDPHHPRPAVVLRVPDDDDLADAALRVPFSNTDDVHEAELDTRNVVDSFVTVGPILTNAARDREQIKSFFSSAYEDEVLRTYHCDKVRKMPLSALDPSMLVGFLIDGKDDWQDFCTRVEVLSSEAKPVFSVAASPPSWMRRPSASPATARSPSTGWNNGIGIVSQSPSDVASSLATSPPVMVSEPDGAYSEPEDWELDSTDASSEELGSTGDRED